MRKGKMLRREWKGAKSPVKFQDKGQETRSHGYGSLGLEGMRAQARDLQMTLLAIIYAQKSWWSPVQDTSFVP